MQVKNYSASWKHNSHCAFKSTTAFTNMTWATSWGHNTFYAPTCSNASVPPLASPPHSTSLMPLHYCVSSFQHNNIKASHKNPPLITLKVPSDRKYVFHVLELIKHWVTRPADFAGSVRSEKNGNIFSPVSQIFVGKKLTKGARVKLHFLPLGYPN